MSLNPKIQPLKETHLLKEEQRFEADSSLDKDESLTEFQPLKGPNSKVLKIHQEEQKIIYIQPVVRRGNTDKYKKQQNMKEQFDPMRKSIVDPKGCSKSQYFQTPNNQIQSSKPKEPNPSLKHKEKYYNKTSPAPCPTSTDINHQQLDSFKLAKNEKDRLGFILDTNQFEQSSKPTIMCEFCPPFVAYKTFNTYYKHVNTQHINEIKDSWPKCQVCSVHLKNHEALTQHCLRAHKLKEPTQSLSNQHQNHVLTRDQEKTQGISPAKSILNSHQTVGMKKNKKIYFQSLQIKTSIKFNSPTQKNNATISETLTDISNKPVAKEEVKRLDISNQEDDKSLALSNFPSNPINIQVPEKHSKFPCKSCTKEFDKQKEHNAHVNKMHKYMCTICFQEFEKLMILSQHFSDVHAPKKSKKESKSPPKKEETQQQCTISMDDHNQSLKGKFVQFYDKISRKRIKIDVIDNTKFDSSKIMASNDIYKTN